MRRDSSCSSGGKTEDSLGRACVWPPRDDAKAHRTWDRGRRSSSSSSSTHPLTHTPTHPLTHSPTHPLTHSPTYPLSHSPTHPLTHSPTHPLSHSPTQPLTHSPTHPHTHSPTHPLTHSPTHPLTQSLVTWHQSKNPQDGSCRTDCLHALPRSKPVVNRRDSRATT